MIHGVIQKFAALRRFVKFVIVAKKLQPDLLPLLECQYFILQSASSSVCVSWPTVVYTVDCPTIPRRDTSPDVQHRAMSSPKVWLHVDFVRAGDQTIEPWRPGVSCGRSASIEHSAGFPANSFI